MSSLLLFLRCTNDDVEGAISVLFMGVTYRHPSLCPKLAFHACFRSDQKSSRLRVFSQHCFEHRYLVIGNCGDAARKELSVRLICAGFGTLRIADGNRRDRREEQKKSADQDRAHLNSLFQADEPALKHELKFVHPRGNRNIGGVRRGLRRRRNRQEYDKTSALSRRALNSHGSFMGFRNPGHETQAEAQAAFRP